MFKFSPGDAVTVVDLRLLLLYKLNSKTVFTTKQVWWSVLSDEEMVILEWEGITYVVSTLGLKLYV